MKVAPIGTAACRRRISQRVAPDEDTKAGQRHQAIGGHGEPGGRHVDIHDPGRVALLIVGRRAEHHPSGGCEERWPTAPSPRAARGPRRAGTASGWRAKGGWRCGAGRRSCRVASRAHSSSSILPTQRFKGGGSALSLKATCLSSSPGPDLGAARSLGARTSWRAAIAMAGSSPAMTIRSWWGRCSSRGTAEAAGRRSDAKRVFRLHQRRVRAM